MSENGQKIFAFPFAIPKIIPIFAVRYIIDIYMSGVIPAHTAAGFFISLRLVVYGVPSLVGG